MDSSNEAILKAMIFSSSLVLPMILKAAIELNVLEIMHRAGPDALISAADIISHFPTKVADAASKLDRMLRLLASHSFLNCSLKTLEDGTVERLYGLTPTSKYFLKTDDADDQGSLASFVSLATHQASVDVWLNAKDVIFEGGALFTKSQGMSGFQYMDRDPLFNNIFNQAMKGLSTITMTKVLDVYKGFDGLDSLVDVGGGTGRCLNMIISKYPCIKGINFDLPHVTQTAPSYPGIEHIGGDMFSSIPKANAIMIKYTLHNWDDEYCVKVLKNMYEALPSGGKVIIIDMIMPEAAESSMSAQYILIVDNTMLTQLGGKERTEKEYKDLCKQSGFSDFRVATCALQIYTVMECFK